MVYIYTTYELIEKINKLDKKQKQIILLLFIILFLLIGTAILKNSLKDKTNIWEYKKISTLETIQGILTQEKIIDNRNKYWELSNIIDKFIDTVQDDSYNDYYKVLTDKYKREINKKEYSSLAHDFINRFVYETQNSQKKYNKVPYSIKKIYKYEENMYLCYISIDTDEMSESERHLYYKNDNEDIIQEKKSEGYIGIKLNEANETYKIFYLE